MRAWKLRIAVGACLCTFAISSAVLAYSGRRHIRFFVANGRWPEFRTVHERISQLEPAVRDRLGPGFKAAGVAWPPDEVVLLVFKREMALELWCASGDSGLRKVKDYRILAASGTDGPKRRRGDGQVPEGIYDLTELNPNSLYHLSIRVNFPVSIR